MKSIVLFVCLFTAVAASALPARFRVGGGRIVGGHNAQPHQAPYMISLQIRILILSAHTCGASLITWNRVLTAAHCAPGTFGTLVAVAGDHNLSVNEGTEQERVVIVFIIHPDYPGGNQVAPNDVAVLGLESSFIPTTFVNIIALPEPDVIPTGWATLLGWGSISNTTASISPEFLQVVDKNILTYEECVIAFGGPTPLDRTNVCTGPIGQNTDACSGDSGGPLVQVSGGILRVIGIVSWGPFPCGNGPSVKVRTSAFISFISQNL